MPTGSPPMATGLRWSIRGAARRRPRPPSAGGAASGSPRTGADAGGSSLGTSSTSGSSCRSSPTRTPPTCRCPTRGFYFVQGYETWDDPETVRATWRLPLRKIVISRWLEEIADEMGEGSRTSRVPNGVDLEALGVDVPPADRPPRVGALLSPHKGEETVAVLEAARERLPELEAATFGAADRPSGLPEWVRYERLPDRATLRRLYNSCSIFLQASRQEGWGLPGSEAMACGCALVTYDNGGSREYASDGETAVVVAVHEPARLTEAIVALAGDRERRLALASRGRERIAEFTWERAVAAMERVLAGGPAEEDAP